MKHLLMGAAALALLTGCNNTDTPSGNNDVVLSKISIPAGDPANAADALAAMSLTDSGSGVLSFADKSIDGATATFTDVSVTGDDSVNVGSIVFEGLNTVDGKATFGKLSINDVVITGDEGDEVEVNLGNVELSNPSAALATWLSASLNGQVSNFPAIQDVSFDSWSMTGLTGDFNEDGQAGTFGVDKIEIRDMTGESAARALISGIAINVDGDTLDDTVKVNLGSLSMTNVDAKFVKVLQENAGDEDALMAAMMGAVYDNPMDPGYDGVQLSDFSVDASGVSFAIASLDAAITRNAAGQPVKYVTQPFTMTLNADAEGEGGAQVLQGLSMLGYESLTLKGEGSATYDPDQDIVDYDASKNYIELVDGAKFSFGGKLEGYSAYTKEVGSSFNFADMADGAEPDPEAMMAAMGKLTFHNLEFSIDDDSLLDRAFNAAATAQGQDPQDMKNQIGMVLGMAPMMVGDTGIDMALVTEMTGALGSFVSDGGSLTLKFDPAAPLSVATIMENPDPAAYTKESLGFSATHD